MRYILVVLLLANIAALVWFQLVAPTKTEPAARSVSRAPVPLINTGLLKISELGPQP